MKSEISQLQILLNARFGTKLRVDGDLGQKTLVAALGNLLTETEVLRQEVSFLRERLQDLTSSQDNLIEGPRPSP